MTQESKEALEPDEYAHSDPCTLDCAGPAMLPSCRDLIGKTRRNSPQISLPLNSCKIHSGNSSGPVGQELCRKRVSELENLLPPHYFRWGVPSVVPELPRNWGNIPGKISEAASLGSTSTISTTFGASLEQRSLITYLRLGDPSRIRRSENPG